MLIFLCGFAIGFLLGLIIGVLADTSSKASRQEEHLDNLLKIYPLAALRGEERREK